MKGKNDMMYILDQNEYDSLKNDGVMRNQKLNDELASFCQMVADKMPIHGWHASESNTIIDGKPAAPWRCIHSVSGWYCDDCPSQKMCPMKKKWSK